MKAVKKTGFYVLVAGIVGVVLLPYIVMVLVSFKDPVEAVQYPPSIWPDQFILDNWAAIFDNRVYPFLTFFKNSFYIAGITAMVAVVLGILSGYALSRTQFPGKKLLGEIFFFTYMFSSLLLLVPLYKLCVLIGLTNTREAVIVCMIVQTMPTAIYMTRSYFDTIPRELEEAGRVDGLNRFQVIFRITVPLSVPGLASVFVYAFMVAWNDVLFAQIFLDSQKLNTLTIGLTSLFNSMDYVWGRMMAASVATALPILLMYAVSQNMIKSDLTAGSVKG